MTVDERLSLTENIILKNADDYKRKYGNPEFVKLPFWIYEIMMRSGKYTMLFVTDHNYGVLFGLKLCPTYSIERPDEIEVF